MQDGNGGIAGRMGLGDVTGAGMRMGVGVRMQVQRWCGETLVWSLVVGTLDAVPWLFWVMLCMVHYSLSVLLRFGWIRGMFEGRKVCRMQGFFPVLCREVGVHWVVTWVREGTKGWFLLVGTLGLCYSVMRWENKRMLLATNRVYLWKVYVFGTILFRLLPSALLDVWYPAESVLSCVLVEYTSEFEGILLAMVAVVMARASVIPVALVHMGLSFGLKYARAQREVTTDVGCGEVLEAPWNEVFGVYKVPVNVHNNIGRILQTTSQDMFWPKVRVWAYIGDKWMSVLTGKDGDDRGLLVADIQALSEGFSDIRLRNAVKHYAPVWWDSQPAYMQGKAAATVLEAIFYQVVEYLPSERDRLKACVCFREHVGAASGNLEVDISDDEFKDCKL